MLIDEQTFEKYIYRPAFRIGIPSFMNKELLKKMALRYNDDINSMLLKSYGNSQDMSSSMEQAMKDEKEKRSIKNVNDIDRIGAIEKGTILESLLEQFFGGHEKLMNQLKSAAEDEENIYFVINTVTDKLHKGLVPLWPSDWWKKAIFGNQPQANGIEKLLKALNSGQISMKIDNSIFNDIIDVGYYSLSENAIYEDDINSAEHEDDPYVFEIRRDDGKYYFDLEGMGIDENIIRELSARGFGYKSYDDFSHSDEFPGDDNYEFDGRIKYFSKDSILYPLLKLYLGVNNMDWAYEDGQYVYFSQESVDGDWISQDLFNGDAQGKAKQKFIDTINHLDRLA